MTERPIIFSAPMVRAILAGTKTQTRRVVKQCKQFTDWHSEPGTAYHVANSDLPGAFHFLVVGDQGYTDAVACPYGQAGDRLWVREAFAKIDGQTQPWIETDYRATYTHGDRLSDSLGIKKRWTPAIHMQRAASRITLEITGVRVERLQHISETDTVAEGIPAGEVSPDDAGRFAYRLLWESLHGSGSWDANPWLWVVEFKRITQKDPHS